MKIVIDEDQKNIDENLQKDRRTANLMVQIANTVDKSIVMEASVPSDFDNNKLPLLNSQVWIENDAENGPQIRYEHFEKHMASKLEIQQDSAMPEKTKRATLVQGGITRLLNTSVELGPAKQKEILTKYMKKLQTSNYDQKTRLEILKSILEGWKKIVEKDKSGEKPLHRQRDFEKDIRLKAKNDKKLNWYKGKDGKSFDSMTMVSATPHGELKQIIQQESKRIKIKSQDS